LVFNNSFVAAKTFVKLLIAILRKLIYAFLLNSHNQPSFKPKVIQINSVVKRTAIEVFLISNAQFLLPVITDNRS
jgi:hypothetical protein